MVDRRGHMYLDSGNPASSVQSHTRGREEELSQSILEQLEWIKGVRVSVQVPDEPAPETRPSDARSGPVESNSSRPKGANTKPRPDENHGEAIGPAVAINRPRGAIDVPASSIPSPLEPKTAAHELPAERGRVWVKVPRSHYYQIGLLARGREPSAEDLRKLVAKEEEHIRTGISLVVPLAGPTAWTATIDMIVDETPLNAPAALPAATDSRRLVLDWGIAGSWERRQPLWFFWSAAFSPPAALRAVRKRPPAGCVTIRDQRWATVRPSRVREFVRRNPDSAVSVLERWTSEGGNGS